VVVAAFVVVAVEAIVVVAVDTCYALPQRPRLLFYEAITLLLGDRTRRSIPNVIVFIPSFHTFFTTHE
jgi:hypothetical protein